MKLMKIRFAAKLAWGLILTLRAASPALSNDVISACEIGVYQSPERDAVVITKREERFRYSFIDGRFGYVSDKASPVSCRAGFLLVTSSDGRTETWSKLPLRVTNTSFKSQGIRLAGQLIEPLDLNQSPPLVVMVHGSERVGWIDRVPYPFLAAAQGVSAFIYDKRGTGLSDGEYNQNFTTLAEDAVAASIEARRLASGRYARFGFFGGSQGGWIAPLAAQKANGSFLVVGFGLIISPLEEDAEQVFSELRQKGYGPNVLRKARVVTDATGAVMACHLACGFETLQKVVESYSGEPWFNEIKGEFTGALIGRGVENLQETGGVEFDNLGIEWTFNSMEVLRDLSIPQLWVLAGEDREAPAEITIQRLETLRREGKPIDVVVFPDADHGITEFVDLADGSRDRTRIKDGYFRLLADWIRQDLRPPYGNSEFMDQETPE